MHCEQKAVKTHQNLNPLVGNAQRQDFTLSFTGFLSLSHSVLQCELRNAVTLDCIVRHKSLVK